MKIYREWLGGSEEIDVSSQLGLDYFLLDVVQNEDAGNHLIERIIQEDEVVVNESEPQYIERYTLMREN